ncbi:MAG: hypothetical protein D6687_09085 [Acidobacteria bacterium]|nr:MAG: hypothetical protein D6687_09085 [Acidobacteriota bacterium]
MFLLNFVKVTKIREVIFENLKRIEIAELLEVPIFRLWEVLRIFNSCHKNRKSQNHHLTARKLSSIESVFD